MAATSLKVQNLPRRRHFLTQSTEVDEQNSLISWKITSRLDFEEFHNRESDGGGGEAWGLDPDRGSGGSRAQPAAGRSEPDFFRAPVLCLASSLAPPSSDGHGQHWPLDEAFILRRRKERGSAPQGCWGRDIGHQPRWRGHNGARGAGIHNTPLGIHVCVDAARERGTLESLKGCVGQTQRIRATALLATPPRYETIHIRGRFSTGPG